MISGRFIVNRIIALTAFSLAVALSSGCALKTGPLSWTIPIEEQAAANLDTIDWPERFPAPLIALSEQPLPESNDPASIAETLPSVAVRRLLGERGKDFRGAYGDAVIIAPRERDARLPLSFLIVTTPYDEDEFPTELRKRDAQFEADRTPPKTKEDAEAWIIRQALRAQIADTPVVSVLDCALFDPADNLEPRGLIVHITSLARRSPYEHAVIQRLRQDGWAVLEVGHPSRMYEPFLYHITPTSDPAHHAPIIAGELDHRLAEWAIGIESALAFLADEQPDLAQRPLVLAGFSLGAIVLPPVAARLDDRVDAAILVAGGANVSEILSNVVLTDGTRFAGFSLAYADGVPDELRRAVSTQYLSTSQLDPYRTAGALRGKRVLLLHAIFDHIVPADTGTLLYNRLGRPERWRYFFGHLGLFWWLPNEANAIARWLDRQLPN